ncbi:vascular endothelial growth factor A-like [Dromaius novaehollandiae]|uniref:vascular endothelial growth factor A-like n=1 Tax=Dromaius novaehollandiae TaxID=8790 RepID=UPI00311FFAA8
MSSIPGISLQQPCPPPPLPALELTALCFHPQQEDEPHDDAGLSKQDLPFLEVYRSSFCQPFLTIVDVYSEYPDEVTYIYKPSCVAVQRCGGCCGDEGQFCAPVEMEMVTIELVKISPNIKETTMVKMDFLAHKQCECRPILIS